MSNLDLISKVLSVPGRHAVPYTDLAGDGRPLILQTYRPPGYTPDCPVVIVQHGVLRNGDDYRDFWMPAADKHQLLIVAVTFSNEDWPGVESYNNGDAFDSSGAVRDADAWSYASIARVFADLRAAGITTRDSLYLFGHSAGGQFVHRLMSSQSHEFIGHAAVGNPGWYTLPTLDLPYPEGLGGVNLTEEHLLHLLAYPLLVLAGDQDTDVSDPNLPSEPAALRQGVHRFARAHHYFEAGRQEAARRNVPFGWTLQVCPGIGHDGRAMSAICASLWFEGQMLGSAEMARLAGAQVA